MIASTRLLRLLASVLVLAAICACGGSRSDAPAPATEETPPSIEGVQETLTMPDALMPLTEGGEVAPRDADTDSLITRFPDGDFETLRARVTTWMPAHGWTLVPGSEVDSERTAASLEEMGMHDAAELARSRPSFGASYQRDGKTAAIVIDSMDGTLQQNISWF